MENLIKMDDLGVPLFSETPKLHTMRYYCNATVRCFDFFAMHMCSTFFFPSSMSLHCIFSWINSNIISTDYTQKPSEIDESIMFFSCHFCRNSFKMNKSIPQFCFHAPFTFAQPETPQLSRLSLLFTVMAPPGPTAYIPPFPFRPSSATSVPSRGFIVFLGDSLGIPRGVVVKWSGSGVKKRKMMVLYTIFIYNIYIW